MFPQKLPLALLLHTAMILLTILIVGLVTSNPLALLGLMAIQPIPLVGYQSGGEEGCQNADCSGCEETDDDHAVREVGFHANHSDEE